MEIDIEEYRRRIMALPVGELHTLSEADPEAAETWSEREGALADAWAEANSVDPDPDEARRLLEKLMTCILVK